jgi:nitrite reductase/ring-hydroxylating ferredoxin subunit
MMMTDIYHQVMQIDRVQHNAAVTVWKQILSQLQKLRGVELVLISVRRKVYALERGCSFFSCRLCTKYTNM